MNKIKSFKIKKWIYFSRFYFKKFNKSCKRNWFYIRKKYGDEIIKRSYNYYLNNTQ